MKIAFKEALIRDALHDWNSVYIDFYRKLHQNFWDEWYVDTIMQKYRGYEPSDIISFARIHYHINTGSIVRLCVDVGNTPGADKDVAYNNDCLSQLLSLFEAEFSPEHGAGADADGYLRTKGYAVFERTVHPEVSKEFQSLDKYLVFDMVNEWIPLEVGYTEGHVTYLHLLEHGAVARWAYESKELTILIALNGLGHNKHRSWKYHVATPLDMAIAKANGYSNRNHLIDTAYAAA
jgi:hypothetical protein